MATVTLQQVKLVFFHLHTPPTHTPQFHQLRRRPSVQSAMRLIHWQLTAIASILLLPTAFALPLGDEVLYVFVTSDKS